jgi:TRAP-type C4-dicarboxylate transport system substrate-binding protein
MIHTLKISLGMLGFSIAALLGTAPAQATTTLLINTFLPAPHIMNAKVLVPWAKAVNEATEGRVKIQIPPASVAAPDQLWNAVRNDVVDGAYLFNGIVSSQLKLMQMPQLPFLGTSAQANSVALWRTYNKYFKAAGEYRKVHLLALVVFPTGIMYGMADPINSEQDLQGKKVWATPGVPARMMSMANAGVISTPAAKMSEVVAGGLVSAFVGIPDMDAQGFKVMRYAKYATTVPGGLSAPSFSLIVNRKKWESLSQQDRDIITKLSGESFARRMSAFDDAEKAAHAEAVKSGVVYHAASPQFVAELRKSADVLTKEWLATAKRMNVNGEDALAYYSSQSAADGKPAGDAQ